jgi:ribose transport system ATP-binding protein
VEPGPGWLEAVITAMIGRTGAVTTSRGRRAPGEVILEVENLAGQPTPTQASLTVRRGEVVGIFGLVGSGRTELARAIFGLDRIGGGVVTVRGQPVSRRAGPTTRWRAGVGMVSEDRNRDGLAIRLSVADNVMLSKLGAGDLSLVTRGRQRRAVAPWIERLAVQVADLFQPISSLSGGNQQKVALARLLHHDVDLWILDEPTRGIDVGSKATIYQLIGELVGRPERPKAVLMISGDLRELLGLCDRIAVMHRGELGPLIEVSDADEHALLKAATGGAAA